VLRLSNLRERYDTVALDGPFLEVPRGGIPGLLVAVGAAGFSLGARLFARDSSG